MPVIREDRPAYRVLATAGFYGPDDHLYPEGAMLYYDGVPNMEFEALNGAASKALSAYIESLDKLGRDAAEKAGRHYSGLPRTLDDAVRLASEDARRPQLVKDGPGRPIMGARNDTQKQKIEAIVEEADKPQDGRKGRGGLSI